MKAYKRFALILIAVLMCACCFSNIILAAGGNKIALSAWDRSESLAFQMTNMAPGDTEMKEYAVTISDKRAVAVRFDAELYGADDTLAEVLQIKVERNDRVLYDGTFENMPALTEKLTGKLPQTLNYRITVSLDASVGNEYMGKTLSVDFNWSIERKPYTPTPPLETTTTVRTTPIETTSETTTAESTTEETTTETTPVETTTQSEETTTVETTTAETTSQATTAETTSFYEETTTESMPPVIGEPCCECCVGYSFPHSCNFGSFGENDVGCDLPWCCAGGNDCFCPWCWIIPLIILLVLIVIIIVIIRKLTKKENEEEENADEQATE